MHSHSPNSKSQCGSCHECPIATLQDGPLQGWRLVAMSAGLFLGPIVLATVGAMLTGDSHLAQFIGGLSGLVLGLVISVLISKYLNRPG